LKTFMRSIRALSILFLPVVAGLTPRTVLSEPVPTPSVRYELTPVIDHTTNELHVQMRFAVPTGADHVDLQMPTWSPGDYHYQHHARSVVQLAAVTAGANPARLPVTHPDPDTWSIQTSGASAITVSYVLPETPPGIFSDNIHFDPHYAFFAGPAAYLYIVGHKDLAAQITVVVPNNWQVKMPLPSVGSDASEPNTAVTFVAPDYDTLADSPMVMGDAQGLQTRQFTVDNVTHTAVYFGKVNETRPLDSYTPVLRRIVQAENDIMGGPPYGQYDFLFGVGEFPAGLEHLNSTRIGLWLNAPPRAVGSLVAHEFFHLWNVKRIRPSVLGPFDYIEAPRTRNLWFAEGVTEYYAHIALRRAGLTSEMEFLDHWRRAIDALQRNPARLRVTADESSLRVWEAGNSSGYGGLSYYQKGELIGLCLDLKIRHVTDNRKSLDDVMRALLQKCNPPKPGYGEDELRDTINQVAGHDLTAFYNLLARSTREMPFTECLAYAGLDVNLRPVPNSPPDVLALRAAWSAENAAPAEAGAP
jgi:predicted metalloprotease with PDZ domain